MKLLRLINTNLVPVGRPAGYRYIHQEDGHLSGPFNGRSDWFAAILKHKKDNGYDIPENWQAIAEDQLARIQPAGWAYYEDGTAPEYFANTDIKGEDVLRGTRVLAELVAKVAAFKLFGLESPLVTQQKAEERALICSRCPFNIAVPGCFSCSGIANTIADVASSIKTSSDQQLKNCGICKCSNEAQTRVRIEVLKSGVSDDMMQLWPQWCWKGKELRELAS